MRKFTGRCHCGNISYEFTWPGTEAKFPVRACGCTFCRKHGGVYTSHPEGELEALVVDESLLNKYTFGTKTADFYVCRSCGVVPFVTSTIEDDLYAVVNVLSFENVDSSVLETSVSDFDGEVVGERLARRRRNWIPHVKITVG